MARLRRQADSDSDEDGFNTTISRRIPSQQSTSPEKASSSTHRGSKTPIAQSGGSKQRMLAQPKDDVSLFRPLTSLAPDMREASLRSPIRERLNFTALATPRLANKRSNIGKKINVVMLEDSSESLTPMAATSMCKINEDEPKVSNSSLDVPDPEKDLEDVASSASKPVVVILSDSEDDEPVKPRARRQQRSQSIDLAAEMENLQIGGTEEQEASEDLEDISLVSSDRCDESSEGCFESSVHEPALETAQQALRAARPTTPELAPESPSKPRLKSPTKDRIRIPPAPGLRASLDGFWSVEQVNDWNDKHSPRKVISSPIKNPLALFSNNAHELPCFSSEDEDDQDVPSFRRRPKTSSASDKENPSKTPLKPTRSSPLESPEKTSQPRQTPAAASREAKQARKAFDESKRSLAAAFIAELDQKMCKNAITDLTQATGGIRLDWNPRLTKTAGVAHNRQRLVDGQKVQECYIELSEKVIDNVENLRCTLAHEYCHLYNFVIDEERRPKESHGRAFKTIAAKVMKAFAHYDVKVTTRHNYEIQYTHEYICIGRRDAESGTWLTSSCRRLEKRHGSGLKMGEFQCKSCRGHVVQVKPQPKGLEEAKDLRGLRRNFDALCQPKKLSVWNQFCKDNQGAVREQLEQAGSKVGLGEVMAELRVRYAALKVQEAEKSRAVEVVEV